MAEVTAKPAAMVLAGGQGRRLGGVDKALLPFDGQPLLAHILDRLNGQAAPIAVSANGDPARFASFGIAILADGPFQGHGPLAGVLVGLDWAAGQGAGVLLTVTCDTPFLPADLAVRLHPAPSCAMSAGRTHPLVALWPVAAREALRRFLATPGSRAVGAFAATLGMRAVEFAAVATDPFLNVNTLEDLARAEAQAERMRTEGPS